MKDHKKAIEIGVFSFLGIIIVVATLLLSYQVTYANKIYRNVSVAGIDLSGKTKAQAAFLLQKKFSEILNGEFTLKSGEKEIKVKVADTGLVLDIEKTVNNCFQIGRSDNFVDQLLDSGETIITEKEVIVTPIIEQQKYDDFIKIAVAQFNTSPVNASLSVEQGAIKEVAEQSGKIVDTANLDQQVLGLINETNSKTIELVANEVPPSLKISDFKEAENFANNILSKNIKFTYEDKVYSPNRTEIGFWIKFNTENDKITASLNNDNIMAYLNQIAKNFEVIKKDRKINQLDNSVLEEGKEGKLLDKNAAISQIVSQVKGSSNDIVIALATYSVAPSEIKVFPAEGLIPGRFEGRYLDVDLATQKLCRVESTAVVDCFIISSGKPGMPTPTGTFSITGKSPRSFSSKYGLWMPWWQQFNGPYGIHELPETDTWKEVPDHLGTPVSHGCVRLGVGPAQEVYNWTSIGTPVYIHK